jgi:ABC-type uncharacterized transport system permease subunit
MTDFFLGMACGALISASLAFLYGFISAWVKDKKK